METATPEGVRRAIVELRERHHRTYDDIAALLGVGYATVNRVLRLHRESGSIAPRPRAGGNPSPIRGRIAKLLVAIVTRMPDATVAELKEALEKEASIATSRASVQRAMRRLGYSKKRRGSGPWSKTRPSIGKGVARTAR